MLYSRYIYLTWREKEEEERKRGERKEKKNEKDEGNITPTFRTSSLDPPLARERVWVCRSSVAHAPIHQDHVKATFLNQTACLLILFIRVSPHFVARGLPCSH